MSIKISMPMPVIKATAAATATPEQIKEALDRVREDDIELRESLQKMLAQFPEQER